MNTSKLSHFAPQARVSLQEQVGAKLDYVLGADTAELREKSSQISQIRSSVEKEGREAYIDRIAYTWFNRISALRFIDARGYHPFGCRVITAEPGKVQPEILALALSGALPPEIPADRTRINDLLDGRIPSGNPQAECIATSCSPYRPLPQAPSLPIRKARQRDRAPPARRFTHPASVAEGFRTEISDEDCADVEIIGWLYQFYISEKKDEDRQGGEVGRHSGGNPALHAQLDREVHGSELVGSTMAGDLSQSPLKGQMEYYIEPAEQTDEVNAQQASRPASSTLRS